MTVADFEYMSIGMIFGTIIEYANAAAEASEESEGSTDTRYATAEDYLAF